MFYGVDAPGKLFRLDHAAKIAAVQYHPLVGKFRAGVIAHPHAHTFLVGHDAGGAFADDRLDALHIIGQQYDTRTAVGHETDYHVTAHARKSHDAEPAPLIGLQIHAQQRCTLIEGRAVHRARFLIHRVHRANKAHRLTPALCQLSDCILYIAHSATLWPSVIS